MLIALRKPRRCRTMRFYGRLGGLICDGQQSARCTGNALRGVMRMVHVRPRHLDVRTRVGAETPFGPGGNRQNQLSSDQETDRRQPECRWKNAGGAVACHDWRSVVASTR